MPRRSRRVRSDDAAHHAHELGDRGPDRPPRAHERALLRRERPRGTRALLADLPGWDDQPYAVHDVYTRHHREQLLGTPLVVRSAVLEATGAGLRIHHELAAADSDVLAATFVHGLRPLDDHGDLTVLPDAVVRAAAAEVIPLPDHAADAHDLARHRPDRSRSHRGRGRRPSPGDAQRAPGHAGGVRRARPLPRGDGADAHVGRRTDRRGHERHPPRGRRRAPHGLGIDGDPRAGRHPAPAGRPHPEASGRPSPSTTR